MSFVEGIKALNDAVNGIVWGPYMLVLLVGTGVLYTMWSKGFQITKFKLWWRNTSSTLVQKKADAGKDNISPFQAVMTAMSATLGVGNIAGVATAIASGGPGAVFWMCLSAFFGGMTKYAEVVLAVKYRQIDDKGFYHGGPMYYITNGLGAKWKPLAVIFAIFTVLASFGIGNMTQSNAISGSLERTFGINPMITGIVVAVLVGLVIIGGIKRIAAVAEKLIPATAVFWVAGCVVIIIINIAKVPAAFGDIFAHAFGLQSAVGGVLGYTVMQAVRRGIARGVFSNEAGLGSAPIAHAVSRQKDPVKQGSWAIFEVFFDTIINIGTALVILTAGLYLTPVGDTALSGAPLSIASFSSTLGEAFGPVFGQFGAIFVSISILFFAGTTIIGWSFYAERCLGFLTKNNPTILLVYKMLFCALVVVGAMGGLELVWDIADTLNGLMAIPNLIALVLLSKVVIGLTKKYVETGSSLES